MADRFYTPKPLTPGDFVLEGPEAHHLATVRRHRVGDRVVLFNGNGNEYPAEVIAIDRRSVSLAILAFEARKWELGFPLLLASALPKGDRADFLIEKLTELGVARFVPLITERSIVSPKESKVEKFERQVIEASKQCGRNVLMAIDPPQSLPQFLRRNDFPPLRFVLHTDPNPGRLSAPKVEGAAVMIGPEGGWTDEEMILANSHGWQVVSLGRAVLRVETAAVAAAAVLGHLGRGAE